MLSQQLKHEVVQSIRHNQTLSQQLDSMDIKIGLLIQNRITLQVLFIYKKKYYLGSESVKNIILKKIKIFIGCCSAWKEFGNTCKTEEFKQRSKKCFIR